MSPPGTFVSGPQATRDAALFTDLYELTMAASYLREGMNGRATFSLFVRKLPKGRAVLADAGMKTARCAFLAGASMSSNEVRRILDRAGLDEESMDRFLAAGAPIDAFGVGTRMDVSADAPYLDMAYKLVEYEGRHVLKTSAGKATGRARSRSTGFWGATAGSPATCSPRGTSRPPPGRRRCCCGRSWNPAASWRPIRRSPRFAITVRRRSPPCRREFAGSGTPPEEIVAPPRVRRRQKTAHVQVRKGTTLLQTGHGPRVARAAKTPKVKKR